MKYFKRVEGDRLYLSPMHLDDAVTYTKWMNDPKVIDGLGSGAMLMSIPSEKQWIESIHNKNEPQFAIVRKEDDVLIGNGGLNAVNMVHQTAEVGLFIGEEENRNKGYGTEALVLLLEYAFSYLNLHNVSLNVYAFNKNAITCYQKVGFKEIGRKREAFQIHGKRYDIIQMDILKTEFTKKR